MNRALLPLLLLLTLVACQNGTIDNPIPEFRNVDGPTGDVGYLDNVVSHATADLKGWENAEVYFRYATSPEDIRSIRATELTDVCDGNRPVATCGATMKNAWDERREVYPVGTTVYYQWLIDYSIPGGEDVATVEGPLGSYRVVQPQSCEQGATEGDAACPADSTCVRDFLRSDPESGLAPTVCRKT